MSGAVNGAFASLDSATTERLWLAVESSGFPRSPEGFGLWVRARLEPSGKYPLVQKGANWVQANPEKVQAGIKLASILFRGGR